MFLKLSIINVFNEISIYCTFSSNYENLIGISKCDIECDIIANSRCRLNL